MPTIHSVCWAGSNAWRIIGCCSLVRAGVGWKTANTQPRDNFCPPVGYTADIAALLGLGFRVRFLLLGEAVAVYCENHMEHMGALCGRNVQRMWRDRGSNPEPWYVGLMHASYPFALGPRKTMESLGRVGRLQGTCGCEPISSQQFGIKYMNPNVSPYLRCSVCVLGASSVHINTHTYICTECSGEYLDRREKKWREVGENCITRSIMTCTLRQV
jgi:hypothetical protein